MKNRLASTLRTTAALVAWLSLPVFAQAGDDQPVDRAASLLAGQGFLTIRNAGPYVETGTYQIQVTTALGRPTHRLANGTWLFANYEVEESRACGTLVVRFEKGRVRELTLVTPAVATAMLTPRPAPEKHLVAQGR